MIFNLSMGTIQWVFLSRPVSFWFFLCFCGTTIQKQCLIFIGSFSVNLYFCQFQVISVTIVGFLSLMEGYQQFCNMYVYTTMCIFP